MTTIASTADHAADQMKETASHARGALLELAAHAMNILAATRAAELRGVDTVLERLGLQRRPSAWTPVFIFAAGATAAATAVYLAAPSSGKDLRRRIARFLDSEKVKAVEQRIEDAIKPEVAAARRPPNGAKHAD